MTGHLKGDGKATNVTAPGATTIDFGELYRIDGWTGFALKAVGNADTERGLALECSSERIWYVSVPAGVAAAKGDILYWTAAAGFKRGSVDLATAAGEFACKVEEAKDANNVAGVRALNIGA